MRIDEFIKSVACLIAYRDERHNQVPGMMGVLFVLRNRVNAGWHDGWWVPNIRELAGNTPLIFPDNEAPFAELLQRVDGVYDGSTPDSLTNGALHYLDMTKTQLRPPELLTMPNRFPRVAQVGTTTYFGDTQRGR